VVSLAELAGRTGGFSAREIFEVDTMTYPYGIHLAHVEVDPDSGGVRILGYFIGYEVGRAIVPALVEGQLVGGAAQGIAGALLEEFRYTDDGQPLSTTLADYLLPTAGEVPPIGVLISEDWPAASNALGVRGAGEGGATGCGAAIAAAVDDALGRPGSVRSLPIPLHEARRSGDGSGL
jgi:CO/xanthine dehydrogenase Mo-binding subunit